MWWEIWIFNLQNALYADSIKAKLFGTYFLLSAFHVEEFLITCNKTSHTLSIYKECEVIWLKEFENYERVMETLFKIILLIFILN